jgi:hypothetical protein
MDAVGSELPLARRCPVTCPAARPAAPPPLSSTQLNIRRRRPSSSRSGPRGARESFLTHLVFWSGLRRRKAPAGEGGEGKERARCRTERGR